MHEANVESLRATLEVGDADRTRVDLLCVGKDALVEQQGVVHLLALKVAVTHDFGAAKHLGVELIGAVHVLNRDAEMLNTLQSSAEWGAVALCRRQVALAANIAFMSPMVPVLTAATSTVYQMLRTLGLKDKVPNTGYLLSGVF